MRPPDHWHVRHPPRQPNRWRTPRSPRNDFAWWVVVGSIAVVVGIALIGRAITLGGGDGESSKPEQQSVANECDGACPTATEALVSNVAAGAPAPNITGRSAVVMEQSCGAVLFGRNPDLRLPPASLTKIATALVAEDWADLDELVSIDVNSALLAASTNSTVMGLQPGQMMSLRDLMYGLLLASGNDAAIAIAEHVGGGTPAFVELMNEKVAELGLENTRFSNPHGLDQPGLYSSAYDMAVLGRELLADPQLASIVQTKNYQPAWDGPQVWNGNELLNVYPDAIGVKIGYTENAGQTIVAAAERDGRTVIVSVLSAWDRYSDAMKLLEWAFTETETACP